jgi:hypothetical protein
MRTKKRTWGQPHLSPVGARVDKNKVFSGLPVSHAGGHLEDKQIHPLHLHLHHVGVRICLVVEGSHSVSVEK